MGPRVPTSSRGGVDPISEPPSKSSFIDLASGHRQHGRDSIVGRDDELVPVEHHEHHETGPCKALVAVEQRVVARDPHGEDGSLVYELRVELLAPERSLGA